MKKTVLYSLMVLMLVLGLVLSMAAPVMASEITATKQTDPLDGVYYVGDTIYYEMTVTNPAGNSATNTLTRIWDTLPDDTVIEFLYEGSPWGNAANGTQLIQAPGQSHNFTAQYIVAEADIVWLSGPGYYGVRNEFRAEGYDSAGDDVFALTTRNSQVIVPGTEVGIESSATVVGVGDVVDLTITEMNTGNVTLTDVYVELWRDGVYVLTLDETSAGWSSDGNADDVLDVGETWSWTVSSGPITGTTTFVVLGFGLDPEENWISFDEGYLYERDQVTVSILPPVGGTAFPVNRLALLAPWIGLAAIVAGAVVFVRRRQTQS